MFKKLFHKFKLQRKSSNFNVFEKELNSDFDKLTNWVKKLWDPQRVDYLDSDIILIKQNMFIISLNSLIENYFEKTIKYVFNDYLDSNLESWNHFYLAKSYFVQSEREKIDKIIKNNHNASYTKWFLSMLEKTINSNTGDIKVFEDELNIFVKNEMIKEWIIFDNFKSTLWNIKEARDSLWHNFDKFFSNNSIDYKSAYFKEIDIIKKGMKIVYISLENTLNVK